MNQGDIQQKMYSTDFFERRQIFLRAPMKLDLELTNLPAWHVANTPQHISKRHIGYCHSFIHTPTSLKTIPCAA
jgi:hypothetical protein